MDNNPIKERRQVWLRGADVRMTDGDGPGTMVGVPVKFGSLNDRGECFIKGAYAEDIPNFLEIGFNCDAHEWNYRGVIGFPIAAEETDDGLVSTFQFHSTDDAQRVRTKVKERLDNGKAVCLSQGFKFVDYFDIYPKNYQTELPKYFRADQLGELMTYAAQFPRIRIVRKARIWEWSIVTAGSQEDAMATQVRSAETRSEYLGESIEGQMSISALYALTDALFYRVLYPMLCNTCMCPDGMCTCPTKEQNLEALSAALDEYKALMLAQCDAMMSDPDSAMEGGDEMRMLFGEPGELDDLRSFADSRIELRMKDHADAVLSAVSGFKARMERARSWRAEKRAGRELSEKNLSMLKQCAEGAQSVADSLTSLVDKVEMKMDRGSGKKAMLKHRLRNINPISLQ